MRILDLLFPPRADEKLLRDVPLETFLGHLAPRLVEETRPATTILFSFGNPQVRAAVHEAKYHGSHYARKLLAAALVEYLHDMDESGGSKTSLHLVPIPLGRGRQKERGFNQIAEVARAALRQLSGARDITVDETLLERTRETVSQVSLPREKRLKNMRGAFRSTRPADPAYVYIVVDDVITTGATLQAAVDALEAAGAREIIPLALAH